MAGRMGDELDDLFAEARTEATQAGVPPALMARVLADALDHQPAALQAGPEAVRRPPAVQGGFWASLLAAFGGGGTLAGGVAAALVGVWIGFAGTESLRPLTEALWPASGSETVELMPGFGDFWMEG